MPLAVTPRITATRSHEKVMNSYSNSLKVVIPSEGPLVFRPAVEESPFGVRFSRTR